MHWHHALAHCAGQGRPYVIATVLATTGSVPRDGGSKMVITANDSHDSIGGGQFEYLVIAEARQRLEAGVSTTSVHHFPLAAAATQCCGGSATVLLEAFAAPPLQVVVFGAGHVGRRVIDLLQDLDAQLQWFDDRSEVTGEARLPCLSIGSPSERVATLAPLSEVLVLTHDHQLDFELVAALLQRDFTNIGLIGSQTKWRRFRARLLAEGFGEEQLARVRCPVGTLKVASKQPMAIAVAIVAELLERQPPRPQEQAGLTWRQVKSSLLRSDDP